MAHEIRVNDVAQIDPEFHDTLGGHFFVTQRVHNRTAFGYLTVPGHGLVAFRVPVASLRYIGVAVWVGEPNGGTATAWRLVSSIKRRTPNPG